MNLQAVTIKDSDNNMQWNEGEGLLTYRARKVYSFVPELSAEGFKDPNNIFVTGNTVTQYGLSFKFLSTSSFLLPFSYHNLLYFLSSQHSILDWLEQDSKGVWNQEKSWSWLDYLKRRSWTFR